MSDDTPTNLVSALSDEITRVSLKAQRWRDMIQKHSGLHGMTLGLRAMEIQINKARRALGTGDPLEMLPAYQALKEYSDDD